MSRRRKKSLPTEPVRASIASLSHDGRGVAKLDGKTVFIERALPGEEVSFLYTSQRRSYDEGRVHEIHVAAAERVEPRCPHFGICGGCSLQHLAAEQQIAFKQAMLLDNLQHLGKVTPEEVAAPLTGPSWGYRRKARLGVRFVPKKGKVLVGFREKQSRYLADLSRCEVLHPSVGERLAELGELIGAMQARDQIAQIEVAVGDGPSDAGAQPTALAFRNLQPLCEADLERLTAFGRKHGLQIHLQPKGPDSVELLWPERAELRYQLTDHDVEIAFRVTDFTQVNADINRAMVNQALDWLEPAADDRVLDLFCGLGNFTLPLARRVGAVVGVEGEAGLIERARENAARNGIDNVQFHVADLSADAAETAWAQQDYDKILLDPPRSGALEVLPLIARLRPERIVYVSCNPATLARDAGVLVHAHGYRLRRAGAMDMFPHTGHVESMALFTKK